MNNSYFYLMHHPSLYMIGGPNGAGKTTIAMKLVPDILKSKEYVNADAIASGISPFKPQEVSFEAGRLMVRRIHELAEKKEDFAFETTMASRTFYPFLKECKKDGYRIHIVYLWIESPALGIARVRQRVKSGGHYVPEEIVRRRYYSGLMNFLKLYSPLADLWALYDNSSEKPIPIAHKLLGAETTVYLPTLWNRIQRMIYEKEN